MNLLQRTVIHYDEPSSFPSAVPSLRPTISNAPSLPQAVVSCASQKCVKFLDPNDQDKEIVDQEELYGIRCCSDTLISYFEPANPLCPNLWVYSKDLSTTPTCVHDASYSDALAMCQAHGARLCTAKENLNDCTKPARCSLNDWKVWTSTPPSAIIYSNTRFG